MDKLYPPKCAICGHNIYGKPDVKGSPPEMILIHNFDCKPIRKAYKNANNKKVIDSAVIK